MPEPAPQPPPQTLPSTPLFPLGRTVMTRGIAVLVEEGRVNPAELLVRHEAGDWGELASEDYEANTAALQRGARIFSSYPLATVPKVWVITEADRSATTLLLPEEY